MPYFGVIKFILGKLGINFTGEHMYKIILLVFVFIMLGIVAAWIHGLMEENKKYAKQIETYQIEVSILRNNEKKLSAAIAESKNKLEEMSVSLKEKTKKFEEWKNKKDHEKYSSKIMEIFKMIDASKIDSTLDTCLNINKKISGLSYEDF